MDVLYLSLVIILFILAVSAILVGVSNDAVNFLNSAIGSKVASIKVILIIASAGILIGATFSSGMMEVARKGIFYPEVFSFKDIMVVFLSIMIMNVILLDIFNTIGFPTSTTVAIVFGLLGASTGISLLNISKKGESLSTLSEYINSAGALAIIAGILLSVAIGFIVGALIQYIVRLLFTFNYLKNLKYFASIWGGLAIAGITYFIVIKGAKGSSLIPQETIEWIKVNTLLILSVSFVGWTIILQILYWLFKANALKIIVLVGTFALAMAFAGNDLVNFIGVPLAGFSAFKDFMASGISDPSNLFMGSLNAPVTTDTYLLVIAGVIMIATLWFSKKSRSVIETSNNLGRQSEGHERFKATGLSRAIVRFAMNTSYVLNKITPPSIQRKLDKRFSLEFEKNEMYLKETEGISFDLVRASVNLVVAASLIAIGTSYKLPLSTTYVTFMVAMGTSLSDRAWGRESAVYRITGVFSVIGGWFLTALAAFALSLLIAIIIFYGAIFATVGFILLALFMVYRTQIVHKKAEKKRKAAELASAQEELDEESLVSICVRNVIDIINRINSIYILNIEGLKNFSRKKVKKAIREVESLDADTSIMKSNVNSTILKLREQYIETGPYYMQIVDYLRELNHGIKYVVRPTYEHIENNHKPLIESQSEDITKLSKKVENIFKTTVDILNTNSFAEIADVKKQQDDILDTLDALKKNQVRRIKNGEVGTKNSILYLEILTETKNMVLFVDNILKAQKKFIDRKNHTS